jgi:hypothetical protein
LPAHHPVPGSSRREPTSPSTLPPRGRWRRQAPRWQGRFCGGRCDHGRACGSTVAFRRPCPRMSASRHEQPHLGTDRKPTTGGPDMQESGVAADAVLRGSRGAPAGSRRCARCFTRQQCPGVACRANPRDMGYLTPACRGLVARITSGGVCPAKVAGGRARRRADRAGALPHASCADREAEP